MAEYKIDPEPDIDRVWLLDHPKWPGRAIYVERGSSGWEPSLPSAEAVSLRWSELLELGTVTDEDPDDVSWLPPGPWRANPVGVVFSADKRVVLIIDRSTVRDGGDQRLAALIARLVNEHVARHIEQGGGA